MATLRMEVKNGTVVFDPGTYLNDEAVGQIPADMKLFLAERTRKLTIEASKETLFEVTLTWIIKDQVDNIWSNRLEQAFNKVYGNGAWDEIKNTLLNPANDSRPDVFLNNLDIYFFVNRPMTTSKVQIYAENAIEAGKMAKNLISGNTEDVRVIGVQMITPATGKRK